MGNQEQSAPSRAYKDTESCLNYLWYQLVLGLAFFAFGVAALFMTLHDGALRAGLVGLVAGFLALVFTLGFTFLFMLILAPLKQRNEARAELKRKPSPIPLPNRDTLIRAIGTVSQKALDAVREQEHLDSVKAQFPSMVFTDIENEVSRTLAEYQEAMNDLRNEELVAGPAFANILDLFAIWVNFQIFLKRAKPSIIGDNGKPLMLDALEFAAQLGTRRDSTIRKLHDMSR